MSLTYSISSLTYSSSFITFSWIWCFCVHRLATLVVYERLPYVDVNDGGGVVGFDVVNVFRSLDLCDHYWKPIDGVHWLGIPVVYHVWMQMMVWVFHLSKINIITFQLETHSGDIDGKITKRKKIAQLYHILNKLMKTKRIDKILI